MLYALCFWCRWQSVKCKVPVITIKALYKSFGDKPVLKGLDLDILEGETLVVVGRSGFGKSVLLKIIIGLLKLDSGSVLVDGVDVTKVSYRQLQEIRKKFGMVFQGSALFDSLTVEQNVGLALRKHSGLPEEQIRERIRECLHLVDLSGTESLYPSELSGGMKKRVGLARAIAMKPKFVLYDEPTTGLDPITARAIDRLIVDMQEKLGITSVVVTHDIDSAFFVGDRIAMLHHGVIHFLGTPTEIADSVDPIVKQFITGEGEDRLEVWR